MDKRLIVLIFILMTFFLASCASPPASPPSFIHVVPTYQEVVAYDQLIPQTKNLRQVINDPKPQTADLTPLSDAGLPCTETYQCKGFCLALEPDTALGYCSDTRTPRGCWEYLLGKNVTKTICS